MWLVRNSNNLICFRDNKPIRYKLILSTGGDDFVWSGRPWCVLKPELFPEVTLESKPKWIRFVKREWLLYVDN